MTICLLYCGPASLTGGQARLHRVYGTYVDALAEYFDRLVVCNTFAGFELPEAQYEVRAPNVSFEALPYFGRVADSLTVLRKCSRLIWRASASWDLLYITLPSPLGIPGYLTARARGIPVVLDVEGDLEAQYEAGRYRGLTGVAARAGVAVFEAATQWMVNRAVTMTQGEGLRQKYGRNGNRIRNIPWSPMSEKMIMNRDDTCEGRRIRLLFVGALLAKKGIFVLLEAAALLRRRLDNFTITYVGVGPYRDELARRVRETGLGQHVELRGGIYEEADLLREFDAADIFVFPTYAEGFPRVIFEAMARGLPVISTRVSGIPGLVKEGRDVLLVDSGSPEAVARAVVDVVSNGDLRRALIQRGRELAMQHTLERTTKWRVEAIRSAFGANGHGRE